jgi:hypothetical protein
LLQQQIVHRDLADFVHRLAGFRVGFVVHRSAAVGAVGVVAVAVDDAVVSVDVVVAVVGNAAAAVDVALDRYFDRATYYAEADKMARTVLRVSSWWYQAYVDKQ